MPSWVEPSLAQALSLDDQIMFQKRNKVQEKSDQLQSRNRSFLQAGLREAGAFCCEQVALPSSDFLLSQARALSQVSCSLRSSPENCRRVTITLAHWTMCRKIQNFTLLPRPSFWDKPGAKIMMTKLLTDLTLLRTCAPKLQLPCGKEPKPQGCRALSASRIVWLSQDQ